MLNILLIGDSLTYLGSDKAKGWVNLLKMWYKNKANIINKGICLNTSQMIRDKFDEIIKCDFSYVCNVCTILLGTNDCYNPNFHISPEIYKENIIYMIDELKTQNPNCIILLITPPLCKINEDIQEYVNQIYEIAYIKKSQLVSLIDLYHGTNNINHNDLESDNIHLNSSGNWKIFCKIKQAIETQYSFLIPNNL